MAVPGSGTAGGGDQDRGLFSYAQIHHLLQIEFSRARRYGYPLSLMLVRVDRLDRLRDLYGYEAREFILEKVHRILHKELRTCDFMGSFGTEQFLVLAPHTDLEGARVLGERLARQIGQVAFEVEGRPLRVTLSAGITTYAEQNALFYDALLKAVERGLEKVVAKGGNGVAIVPIRASTPKS